MKKILLLGGTGAMGVYLVDILPNMGYKVFVTTRRNLESSERDNVEYVQGNAKDIEFLKRTVERLKPDAIVDFMRYSTAEFPAFLGILLNSTSHYLYLSSYRVYADSQPLVESSPRLLDVSSDEAYLKTDEYALKKARQENIIRQQVKRNWTIVRPGITYSKNRFQFGCLEADVLCYRIRQNLPVPIPKEMLDKRTTMTWGRDVAAMISKLILNPLAMGEDFNVVTSESHTWREVAEIYKSAVGLHYREIELKDYFRFCARPQTMYDRMYDRVMDNTKILRVTGMTQSLLKLLSEGLSFEVKRYLADSGRLPCDIIKNARIDYLLGSHIRDDFTFAERCLYFRHAHPWANACCRIYEKLLVAQ